MTPTEKKFIESYFDRIEFKDYSIKYSNKKDDRTIGDRTFSNFYIEYYESNIVKMAIHSLSLHSDNLHDLIQSMEDFISDIPFRPRHELLLDFMKSYRKEKIKNLLI